jgi:hypothetical protein
MAASSADPIRKVNSLFPSYPNVLRILLWAVSTLVFLGVLSALRRRKESAIAPTRAPIGSLEADRQTLNALRKAGADLTRPTEVNFYLYFPTRAAAANAAAQAKTPELPARVEPAADGKAWLCFVSGTMVPTELAIRAASTRLQAVATALGGEYDGWEAAVSR